MEVWEAIPGKVCRIKNNLKLIKKTEIKKEFIKGKMK